MRLFDPNASVDDYWADSNAMKLDDGKVGSFDGEWVNSSAVRLCGQGRYREIFMDKRDPKAPIYSRAFSADEGRTWEWNWYRLFTTVIDRVGSK